MFLHTATIVLCVFFKFSLSTKFLLTVPKEASYDMDYTAVVTAFDHTPGERETVELTYRGRKDSSRLLNSTIFYFDADGSQNWTVVFPWQHMQELGETGLKISLSSKEQGKSCLVNFRQSHGHIFIQTDKPIYTPRQTVKFRIIAVDDSQRLAKYPVKVDIKDVNHITVDRIRYSAEEAFKGQEFELPKETKSGQWSISASFEGPDNIASTTQTVNFEVREYVLPRFSAQLHIDNSVITRDLNWLGLNVTARYVHGKPVFGAASIQLGIWTPSLGTRLLPGASYFNMLKDGYYTKYVRLGSVLPSFITYDGTEKLYVNVNVTESATLENFTIVDTSTFIAHPYYIVSFKQSKKFFKPGFPYTFQVQVNAQSGPPASKVMLYVKVKYLDAENNVIQRLGDTHFLDEVGALSISFNTPDTAELIQFDAIVLDMYKVGFKEFKFEVNRFQSVNRRYIHVQLEANVQKNKDGVILLQYTKAETNQWANLDWITVYVLAKGQIIYTTIVVRNTDGKSSVHLPKVLYPEVSPNMRIVALYLFREELVIDSLFVDTPDYCLQEVSLSVPPSQAQLVSRPKDNFKFTISGQRSMRVGLVAVDKAVFLLNDKQTLTRPWMFHQLASRDQGKDSGDGKTTEEIFLNSGLQQLMIDNNDLPPTTSRVLSEASFDEVVLTDGTSLLESLPPDNEDNTPPNSIRSFFPESWMFEEHTIPRTGKLERSVRLPDSITTWSLLAVGVSPTRGVCVSSPLEHKVQKLFFADVRLPYKATRLEEVKVKIAVYNFKTYAIKVRVVVSSKSGLCFSANSARGTNQNSTSFDLEIGAIGTTSRTVKVIPLKNGELTLRVDLANEHERDIVERTLYVVAEGQRVRKSITFVLDPEAKHVTFKGMQQNQISFNNTSTISNVFDKMKKYQHTTIDLALPQEVIRGTEFCRIAAFGDLMGDIITHAVVRSKSLMDIPVLSAEEVLGDMGPTVHALLYANLTGLMDDDLRERGHRFVRQGITRLLKYKQEEYFHLTLTSQPATWLTAAVVKTLCYATALAYVDKQHLIDEGLNWLSQQLQSDGTLKEQDWRLSQNSFEYEVMLSAEVFIALHDCGRSDEYSDLNAKVSYALHISGHEKTKPAVLKLFNIKRTDKQRGHIYWADSVEGAESTSPFWYHPGVRASSVEATAYALLVFLEESLLNVDAIADWLISQRNQNGAFIGAMDSTVAIQALTKYSLKRDTLTIDLNCNISSEKTKKGFEHFFKFTEENAIRPASLTNVPVGRRLDVRTMGQGLGQMQVNVEYNIPIEKNKNCNLNVSIETKPTTIGWGFDQNNPLCSSCEIGCPEKRKKRQLTSHSWSGPSARIKMTRRRAFAYQNKQMQDAKIINERQNRAAHNFVASKKSYCIHVCLRHLAQADSGHLNVEVEMLTGFKPVNSDLNSIQSVAGVLSVQYLTSRESIFVQFSKISNKVPTCFGFRVVDEEEAERQIPATVHITEAGRQEPSCSLEYMPPASQESLKVFCADFSNTNRGECKCYSGMCSTCKPSAIDEISLHDAKQLVCESPIVYQVKFVDVADQLQWAEIKAQVISLNKTGTHRLFPGEVITLITPSSCSCPLYMFKNESIYMLSDDVEKLVDRTGQEIYRYLLDENALFLRVASPNDLSNTLKPALPFFYLQDAFKAFNNCPA
ncbi:complement C3-like isoform X2 [Physella acuta]|uniref:complement C3-like isoform X2 n=1 Tax=Physella acuta TaxID=109671 RepID=UPI0027DAEA2D|nr:complement C3-like isoform X2 [Physella acuta]